MSDNEMRDLGPFADADQAMRQFANWSAGMPISTQDAAKLSLGEGALRAGVRVSGFELEYVNAFAGDPVLATILNAWLLRARLVGQQSVAGRDQPNDLEGHSGHTST